jgi:RND family efflux transporter MFP subunit
MMRIITCFEISAILLSALFFASCGKEKPQQEEILRPVRYQLVFATGGERERMFSGVAQAGVESRLSFKVGGTVKRVAVKVGDQVTAGDLIAELDDSDYRLQVQQAEASLASAEATERNAASNYDRVRQLWERRNASRNDLDATRAAQESAAAQVRALQKQLELARSQLSYARLTAPVNGAIARVDVEVNENVQIGQAIVQLSSGSELEVLVTVPEILISQIREGQKVDVVFDALPDKKFPARITEVGIAATSFATAFPVTARLDQSDPSMRPGMAAEVLFKFGSEGKIERIVVPSVAVGEDRQGRFVFVVDPGEEGQGIVHRRAVTIGEMTDEGIEILEGLLDGSLVVTAGVSKLVDGQKVKFLGEEE